MSILRLAGLVLATSLATTLALPVMAGPHVYNVYSDSDSGPGTLRQAITDGNALPSNTYPEIRIHLYGIPIKLASPLPPITKVVAVIKGDGSQRDVIDGQSQYPIFVFNASATSIVTIEHLTLKNGLSADDGGCVSLQASSGGYGFTDMEFNNCRAKSTANLARGGAIHMAAGRLTISDSQFFDNLAEGTKAFGGAIAVAGTASGDKLTINNSLFKGNQAHSTDISSSGGGGAIYIKQSTIELSDSVLSGNSATNDPRIQTYNASHGGALYVRSGSANLQRNLFFDNITGGEGGAININEGRGGDIHQGGVLINNTFVRNYSSGAGGAISDLFSDLTLRNNSFAFNDTAMGYDPNDLYVNTLLGEGVYPHVELWNNLFAASAPDIWCDIADQATVVSGHNIVPSASCLDDASADIVTTNNALQGYRRIETFLPPVIGDPMTPAPLAFFIDSPALDAGNPLAPDDDSIQACPEFDGFGNPRAADGNADGTARCDIGAFEWQHEAPIFAGDFEDRIYKLTP